MVLLWILIAVGAFIASGIKVVKEYERGVKFTLGKYVGIMKPGLRIVIPVIQTWERVDMRVKAVDVPDQDCITRDNISVNVNAVIYYKVRDAERAIIQVEHFTYAISQLAQTTMRNIVGEVELDELLANRDDISTKIREIIDTASDPWGLKVDAVELKDVKLPQDMKRVISRQAEAEREKRAVIIQSQGEVVAAKNVAQAAKLLSENDGALHLRTLQSINAMSSDQSNTVVFAIPLEVLRAFEGLSDGKVVKTPAKKK